MLKNILYFIASLILFTAGMILYGVILNLREKPLNEILLEKGIKSLTDVHIEVDRRNYVLGLYSNSVLIKNYKAVFGKDYSKQIKLDGNDATPVGKYYICNIDSNSRYRKFLRVSFPNYYDLEKAFRLGFISKKNYDIIMDELNNSGCPGEGMKNIKVIGIHGIGKLNFIFKNLPFVYNWTNGSVAVSNENIDEIFSVINIGTEVVFKN